MSRPSLLPSSVLRARIREAFYCLLLVPIFIGSGVAQSPTSADNTIRDVQIGCGGVLKVGHWVPVRIQTDTARLPFDGFLELVTIDANAVPVVFRTSLQPDDLGWVTGHVCIGRANAELTARIVDSQGQLIASKNWAQLDKSFVVVPATEQVFLQSGAALNLPAASQSNMGKRKVISVTEADQLPHQWIEYDGIDLVILTTAGSENLVGKLSARQIEALWRWVQRGGRLLLSVGENSAELIAADKPLARFAPGTFQKLETITNSESLEFYAGSASGQLISDPANQSLQVATFESISGNAEVRQGNRPLIVRRNVGFGDIVFVSFDLDQPLISLWKGNTRLLSRLLGHYGEDASLIKSAPTDLGANYGFRDLSGQVRAVGERFRGVSVVPFMLVAALIVLYALCIGPGDYFLLKKIFGRMEFTWITSTLTTLVFGGIAWALVANAKPNKVLINQTEIVDIDAAGEIARGGIWTNVFSPKTRLFDVALPATNEFAMNLGTRMISAFGMPGDGIGGMESRTTSRIFGDSYTVDLETRNETIASHLGLAPVAVASTKQLFSKWDGLHGLREIGNVTFQERGKQIGGVVRNPFVHELRDCFLLYGNSAYLFGNLRGGNSVELNSGTERQLKAFLQFAQPNSDVPRWALADRNETKVFQMLMFFRAAGGQDFTGLSNDYQTEFDLSEHLALGQAIFVGRIDSFSADPLSINSQGQAQDSDRKTTFVRFVFPVRPVTASTR